MFTTIYVRWWEVLEINWNITFINRFIKYVIFYLQVTGFVWQQTFPVRYLFSSYCVTTMPTVYTTLIAARTNTSADGQSHPVESSRAVANSFIGMKSELLKCLFFVTYSWTADALSVPTDKNLKNWRQNVVWLCVDKYVFAEIHLCELSPLFWYGNSRLKFVQVFYIHPVYNRHWMCVSAIYSALGLWVTKLSVDKTPSDRFRCEAIKR